MKLPNPERAVVEIEKLRGYCLSRAHPRGRHKARVFAAALGITNDDADWLRQTLLEEAAKSEAHFGEIDQYGRRYMLDFDLTGPSGSASIRSSWIVLHGEDFPRFVTAYVL